ncbi:unnamed protein product [Anisakis simplex]|uniref:tRNA selenocysteine 1-associated protein 1 (inferred by orthology to a human protein) n=1 Tax=Anisakis simplex TaxID=6269 RepID=A0A0M3KGE5_ANISI|nr:unnamed protein product [Anisakis simplex]
MLHINGKIIPKSKPTAAFNLSFANSPNAPYTEYNLFVNNVPEDMDDAALFLIFGERYHSCRGAKVYRNSDGTSKGLGFVRFSDQTDQQRALLEMNKYRVDGRPLLLKLAQPKYRAPKQSKQPHIQQQQQPYPMHLPQQMMPQHPQITNLYDPSSSNYYMHHQMAPTNYYDPMSGAGAYHPQPQMPSYMNQPYPSNQSLQQHQQQPQQQLQQYPPYSPSVDPGAPQTVNLLLIKFV